MEHRWGQRAQVELEARVFRVGHEWPNRASVLDVSSSGAFIETGLDVPLLTRILVELKPFADGRRKALRIPACVVRKVFDGIGVEWCEALPFAIEDLTYADYVPWSRPAGHRLVL